MLTHTYLPNIGGREIHVAKLSEALAERGHEVTVITSGKKLEIEKEKIVVIRIPEKAITLSRHPREVKYRVLPQLFSVLKSVDCDVIHAHDTLHFTTDASAFVSLIRKIPFVITIHGFYPDTPLLHALVKTYYSTVGRILFKIPRRIICPTNYMVTKLRLSKYKHKITVIPNGVEAHPQLHRETTDKIKLLAVGRIAPVKGLRFAILAMPEILQKFPNIELNIVGPDSYGYASSLKELIRKTKVIDAVNLIGPIPPEEMSKHYQESDVCIVPSLSENFPLVVLEALGWGKPVIASRVGGIPEIITHEKNGLLIRPENPYELAEMVMRLLEDDSLYESLANNGYQTAQKYTWEFIAKRVEEVYEDVLNG